VYLQVAMAGGGHGLAVGAGVCGSAASVFAKLAMEATTLIRVCPVALDALSYRLGGWTSGGHDKDYNISSSDSVKEELDVHSAWAITNCQSVCHCYLLMCFL